LMFYRVRTMPKFEVVHFYGKSFHLEIEAKDDDEAADLVNAMPWQEFRNKACDSDLAFIDEQITEME